MARILGDYSQSKCMATDKTTVLGCFHPLFNKNVPHILEKIFFSLDYESFMSCQDVCSTWNGLFSSGLYNERSKKLLFEKNKKEDDFCHLIGDTEYPWGEDYLEKIQDFLSSGTNPNCCQGKPLYYATRSRTQTETACWCWSRSKYEVWQRNNPSSFGSLLL